MNPETIVALLVLIVLVALAVRYCVRNGYCGGNCGGACGGDHKHHCAPTGCSSCSHLEEEKAEVPERFRLKK